MAYTRNIPQPTDLISVSQGQLLANFQAIYDLIDVNHVTFNSGVGIDGKHKFVSLINQAGDPVTVANEQALFAKVGTISLASELFLRRESNGISYSFTESGQDVIGWTRLPSNILIKWGNDTAANGDTTNAFPLVDGGGNAQPAFAATPFIVMFIKTESQDANNTSVANWNLAGVNDATQYTINLRNTTGIAIVGSLNYRWVAIGI